MMSVSHFFTLAFCAAQRKAGQGKTGAGAVIDRAAKMFTVPENVRSGVPTTLSCTTRLLYSCPEAES